MKQMNLKKNRNIILEKAKPHIIKGGWNEKLFFNIVYVLLFLSGCKLIYDGLI